MIRCSLHNHTNLCDGASSPREMLDAAVAAGFTDFGFSGHSHDPAFSESLRDHAAYAAQIRALAPEYANRLRVYCGIEQDYLCERDETEFDYVIGSAHAVRAAGRSVCVDDTPARLEEGIRSCFSGDADALARAYYRLVAQGALQLRPDVIGHFDLVVKFNAGNRFFDEEGAAYRAAAFEAAEACLSAGAVFELNTGGMARGWRDSPYPARWLLAYLREKGARVMIATDCHSAAMIDYGMREARALLRSVGFRAETVYANGAFFEQALDEEDEKRSRSQG